MKLLYFVLLKKVARVARRRATSLNKKKMIGTFSWRGLARNIPPPLENSCPQEIFGGGLEFGGVKRSLIRFGAGKGKLYFLYNFSIDLYFCGLSCRGFEYQ